MAASSLFRLSRKQRLEMTRVELAKREQRTLHLGNRFMVDKAQAHDSQIILQIHIGIENLIELALGSPCVYVSITWKDLAVKVGEKHVFNSCIIRHHTGRRPESFQKLAIRCV